jgi:hypothetical protein
MKKISFLLVFLTVTVCAFAQSAEKRELVKKEESKNLRHDIRAKRAENHEAVKDASHLRLKEAKTDHQYARADKKAQKVHASRLKRHGVKHPVVRAKHQIRAQDEAKKYGN